MVQVHHDEGVANRIDPESCADVREGIGEALTGERIGQPLSRDSTLILGADVVPLTEGNTDGRDSASAQTARRGRRHWHVRTLLSGRRALLAQDVVQPQLGRPSPHLGRLQQIKQRTPLLTPKLRLPYGKLQALAVL